MIGKKMAKFFWENRFRAVLIMVTAELVLLALCFLTGCGTDVKPSALIGIVRDPGDIDELSACLAEDPRIGDEQVVVTLDKQCLVNFSNLDGDHPKTQPLLDDILKSPEAYLDRLVTFEAVIKKVGTHHLELYTDDLGIRFTIHTDGANVYYFDAEGEEQPVEAHIKYRFRCRIYELTKSADWHGGAWTINARFIVSTNKKIVHPPEPVE